MSAPAMSAAGGTVEVAPPGPRALLVDPSLFTGAYDAALSEGLVANGVTVRWAVRGCRPGEDCEIPEGLRESLFYRGAEGSAKAGGALAQLRKGVSHLRSLGRLVRFADAFAADVVHFQWAVLPVADRLAIRRLARRYPVVMTVHDTAPFNGAPTSRLQLFGYADLLRSVDHLIVHTRQGEAALLRLGCTPDRLSVIPHGPLRLRAPAAGLSPRRDPRWTFVLFGKLQPYKGLDQLVEAAAAIDLATRARIRIIVAGEPLIDLDMVRARIEAGGLEGCVELRPQRQSEAAMQQLFAEADTFVFPYRKIEASGVYHLVKGLGKWIVASDLGCFAEELVPARGTLVPPDETAPLAAALVAAVGRRPETGANNDMNWIAIGQQTRALYEQLIERRAQA